MAIHKESKGLTYLPEPTESWGIFNDYIGSVVIDQRNKLVAVSSPKGHCVAYWELDSLKYRGMETFKDVCGIAAVPSGGLVATTGRGDILPRLPTVTVSRGLQAQQSTLQWDNHLVALTNV